MPKFSNYYFDYIEDSTNDYDFSGIFSVNGKIFQRNDWEYTLPFRKSLMKSFKNNLCPYCKTNILKQDTKIKFLQSKYDFSDYGDKTRQRFIIWNCDKCSYWKMHIIDRSYIFNDDYTHYSYTSKLKEFDENLPESFFEELSISVKQKPDFIFRMNPKTFEKYVLEVFKHNHDYAEIRHIGGPKDLGVDLFYVNSKNEEWLIQVKRRESKNAKETVSTVIHLLGSMTINSIPRGIIVSTADRYTSDAIKLVNHMKSKDFYIELIDYGILNRMIENIIPKDLPVQMLKSDFFKLWREMDNYSINKTITDFYKNNNSK